MKKQGLKMLFAIELEKAKALALLIYLKKKRRRYAVRKMLQYRKTHGAFFEIIPRMRLHDTETFKNFHRMDADSFDRLLNILGPHVRNVPTRHSEEITAPQRLAVTLRYLASGDSMKSVGFYSFRMGASTTSKIIRETCQLIWDKMNFVFSTPSTEMWKKVAMEFQKSWKFPHCLGAIDGKHVVIQALPNHNSLTYNYKNAHSLILMAIADAQYKFIMVDIGALGRNNDGGVFKNSKFGQYILNAPEKLHIPESEPLPNSNVVVPFVFVADEAFPLRKHIMRPYAGRNTGNLTREATLFNAHLSRARRVVENSFGIMANRFRIYRKPIIAKKETVINIIKATVCLHNWLRDQAASDYFEADIMDRERSDGTIDNGLWRSSTNDALTDIRRVGSNNASQEALEIRKTFTNFFKSFNL